MGHMDSIHAQCFVMELATDDATVGPDLWRHHQDGSLGWAFSHGSGKEYSWPAAAVADIAERWRRSGRVRPPEPIVGVLDAHERLAEMLDTAGLDPPDAVIHDLGRSEVRAVWHEPKLVVVVDEIPDAGQLRRESRQAA